MRPITKSCCAVCTIALSGCAAGSGIRPVGPGVFAIQEFRAPAVGGGREAQRLVLAEAGGFCRRQGLDFAPVAMTPMGNPWGIYGPSGYGATFRCLPADDPAAAAFRAARQPAP